MPAHSNLTPDLLEKIKQLANQGYNCCEIARLLNIKRQTTNYWIKKFKVEIKAKKRQKKHYEKYILFKQICEENLKNGTYLKLNKTLKELNLHPDSARQIIKQNPEYQKAIRTKSQAIIEDKTLTIEEAQSRLPNPTDKIIEFKDTKYKIITEDGFIYYKTSSRLNQGDPRGKAGTKSDLNTIEQDLLNHGYEMVQNTFSIKRKAFKAKHIECGFIRQARYTNFFDQECPRCSNNGISKQENEIKDFIEKLGFGTEKYRFKGVTKGKEIDIYIPSNKIGIEYNGLYWHSDRFKLKNYHLDKMLQAEEEGIRLINIFEDEWNNRQFQVKSFLKASLNKCSRKIYARNCIVQEIDKATANEFLNTYHIQGKAFIKIAYGLFFKEELVGLIAGNNHHRNSQNNVFVLNRLVFKEDVFVLGGSSKLNNKLIEYCKLNNFKKLVSWSDNRYSQGKVYSSLGYTLKEILRPDYSYINRQNIRESKQANKKSNLLKKGATGTTETEMAESLGYFRIWDCGKKRWEIDIL